MPEFEEDTLHQWLAEYDEAIKNGALPEMPPVDGSIRQQDAGKAVQCLALLEHMWPRQSTAAQEITRDAPAQETLGVPNTSANRNASWPDRLGKFLILDFLGEGGFGVVLHAFDSTLRREVALKIPKLGAMLSPDQKLRFQREAQLLAQLHHLAIVPVLEAGQLDGLCYIASHLCEGPSLADWLHARTDAVPCELSARLALSIVEGLEHAHGNQILHRDLKPANVLCDGETQVGEPKLRIVDFGLARLVGDQLEATGSGVVLGTASYMAPEQARGASDLDARTDLYSLGAVLYELLVGAVPYRGENQVQTMLKLQYQEPVPPRRLRREIPRDLETICLKCLEKRPESRYRSAAELKSDLVFFLEGRPIAARPVNAAMRWTKLARRHPVTTALSALSALLLCIILIGLPVGMFTLNQRNRLLELETQKAVASQSSATQRLRRSLELQLELAANSQEIGARQSAFDAYQQLVRRLPSSGQTANFAAQSLAMEALASDDFLITRWASAETLAKNLPRTTDPSGSLLIGARRIAKGYELRVRTLDQSQASVTGGLLNSEPRMIHVSAGAQRIAALCGEDQESTIVIFERRPERTTSGSADAVCLLQVADCDSFDLSRDGRWIVAACGDELRVFCTERKTVKPQHKLDCSESIVCVAIEDNGSRVAVGVANHIDVVNLRTGRVETTLQHENPAPIVSIAWNRRGNRLVASREDFRVYLWQLDCADAPRAVLDEHQEWATQVGFASDADRMIAAGPTQTVLWEPVCGSLVRQAKLNVLSVFDTGFVYEDRQGLGKATYVASPIRTVVDSLRNYYDTYSIAYTAKEDLVAGAGFDSIQVWKLPDFHEQTEIAFDNARRIAFTSNTADLGQLHLLAINGAGIQRIDLDSDHYGDTEIIVAADEIQGSAVDIAPNGGAVYWLDQAGVLKRWQNGMVRVISRGLPCASSTHDLQVDRLSLHCDPFRDRAALVDHQLGRCYLVSLTSSEVTTSFAVASRQQKQWTEKQPIEFSADVEKVAVLNDEGWKVLRLGVDGSMTTLSAGDEAPSCLKFMPDAKSFFVGTESGEILWFATAGPRPLARLRCNSKPRDIELAEDGTRLLTTGEDLKLVSWDLRKIREVCTSATRSFEPTSEPTSEP